MSIGHMKIYVNQKRFIPKLIEIYILNSQIYILQIYKVNSQKIGKLNAKNVFSLCY